VVETRSCETPSGFRATSTAYQYVEHVSLPRHKETYNLVISTTGIICPGSFSHHSPCNSLEVHQVVALFQYWHSSNAILSLLLIWIFHLLLLLDCVHVYGPKVELLVKEFVLINESMAVLDMCDRLSRLTRVSGG